MSNSPRRKAIKAHRWMRRRAAGMTDAEMVKAFSDAHLFAIKSAVEASISAEYRAEVDAIFRGGRPAWDLRRTK